MEAGCINLQFVCNRTLAVVLNYSRKDNSLLKMFRLLVSSTRKCVYHKIFNLFHEQALLRKCGYGRLIGLCLVLVDGILCLGGHVQEANAPRLQILSSKSPVPDLIIQYC